MFLPSGPRRILAYNEPANRYEGFMNSQKYPQSGTGARTVRTRGNTHIASGQEYRSTTYGHLNLYFRDDLVRPGSRHITDDWPVHGEVGRETIARGGHAFMAHGGYGQEIWADAALGPSAPSSSCSSASIAGSNCRAGTTC